ncbi:MAG: 4Fe-4S dicluster domain-containing protein [Bacteroidales bacterium]|nr:4Fe-4S dicluster domain-containing protein [Bacteroidales bacterium]
MNFSDYFYYPFLIGTIFLFVVVFGRFIKWFIGLSKIDKMRVRIGLFSTKTLKSVWESIREGLLHHNIFKTNKMLGYMHMSLAFGWFLLIVVGHIETSCYHGTMFFPFQHSIFFRYYVTEPVDFPGHVFFSYAMEILLFFVLSGVMLAYFKRFRSKTFGMKRTTRMRYGDRIGLTALWLIFPTRFLCETFTAGVYHNGSPIFNSIGSAFASIGNLEPWLNPLWLLYSVVLGVFFVAMPYTRYMHIPAEINLIFLRNWGVTLKERRVNTFTLAQVYSCSRCGICIDACQLNLAGIKNSQSVYVLKNIRNKNLSDEVLFNCLICGKCQEACPVGIDVNKLRITQRIETTRQYNSSYDYLKTGKAKQTDMIYFAGCMTHLTPAIKKSMLKILDAAGENYWFMDENKAPCCGRPLMLAGQYDAAQKLIDNNTKMILDSGAKKLLVTCPICYKVFKEDYHLPNIEVVHHSEYILDLVKNGRLKVNPSEIRAVYHDPCELGRGSHIYEQPRELLASTLTLVPMDREREKALCCGGSLANTKISMAERDILSGKAMEEFASYNPDVVVTSCPLCKKTFSKVNSVPVKDLAEVVVNSMKQE